MGKRCYCLIDTFGGDYTHLVVHFLGIRVANLIAWEYNFLLFRFLTIKI